MRSKVLFVVPPCVPLDGIIPNPDKMFSTKIKKEIPLGALTLATYLCHYTQVDVTILDLNLKFCELLEMQLVTNSHTPMMYLQEYIEELSAVKYDMVAISAIFNPTYEYIELISNISKRVFGDAVLCIAGGGLPSNLMKDVFEDAPSLDVISYGEGELALKGLVEAKNEAAYIEKSLSLMTREKLKKGFKYDFEMVESLDEIPPLNYDLIEFGRYNSHARSKNGQLIRAVPLMLSRGCPFKCCFCSSHSVHGRRVRYNSMERIQSDIMSYVKKYDINTLEVWDDNFFVNKQQAYELLDFFEELNLTVDFVNGFPVYQMDDEMAARLKLAGVNVVSFAIESGSPRVLKEIIHKHLQLEMVPKAIECVRKLGMYTMGLFVIGFPGETKEEIQETMEFIHNADLNWANIFIATPLPGSELYQKCIEGKYLVKRDNGHSDFFEGNIATEDFTPQYVERVQLFNTVKKNYVNNLDMKNGNYNRALSDFERVINLKHENPFAYYYAALCANKVGEIEKAELYLDAYNKIKIEKEQWRELINQFGL